MKTRNVGLTVLLIVIAVTVAGVGWWKLTSGAKEAIPAGPTTAKIIRRDFSSSVLATGAVKPQVGSEVKVGTRISGKVVHLFANIGDFVKKGQVIAELEKEDLTATVERAQAELNVAQMKVVDAQSRLRLAEVRYKRQQTLIAADLTSQDAVDDALKENEVEQAALGLAQRQVEAAEAALRGSQATLAYATIIAPISGVIASVSTQEGETVAAGLNAPIFVTILDLTRLQVDAFVDEVDIGKIQVGQKAVFTVDAFPAREFEGKVAAIYPKAVIQENVVYYDVVVDITSPYESLLKPDMTASVTIIPETRSNVLAVPSQAVKREGGKTLLYVLTGGVAEPREVKTGWKDGPWIEIASGVQEGQTVSLSDSAQAEKNGGN